MNTTNHTCGYNSNGSTAIGFPFCENPEICSVPDPTQIGNGLCNTGSYNREVCGYDGGDCCAATCADGDMYTCGYNDNNTFVGFRSCNDPDQCTALDQSIIANGECDATTNNRVCGWDGGDCCEYTCISTDVECGYRLSTLNGTNVTRFVGFDSCEDPDGTPEGVCLESADLIGNGFCNALNTTTHNTALCNWDGGDCCRATCVGSTCGRSPDNSTNVGYDNCRDPTACRGIPTNLGDSICDSDAIYNNEVCGWDGGDCCENSCESSGNVTCGANGYERCRDPDNLYPTDLLVNCTLPLFNWGNGDCDQRRGAEGLNNLACAWDGGDCCAQTCEDGDVDCSDKSSDDEWFCEDPLVINTIMSLVPECTDQIWFVGDGYCDGDSFGHNSAKCGWDGGDCCADTCVGNDAYRCGVVNFQCKDPNSTEYLECAEPDNDVRARVGDGFCDISGKSVGYELNTAACSWDGGDCCPSTCNATANECPLNVYECLDPDATDSGATGACTGVTTSFFGDGACDDGAYNTAACGWDGGDCCASTCRNRATARVGFDAYQCGDRRFQCLDPNATENERGNSQCPFEPFSWIGDGFCDHDTDANTGDCNYDGGDCCESTCEEGRLFSCDTEDDIYCEDPFIGTPPPQVTVAPNQTRAAPSNETRAPVVPPTRAPVATRAPVGTRAPTTTRGPPPTTTSSAVGDTTVTTAPIVGDTTVTTAPITTISSGSSAVVSLGCVIALVVALGQ